MVKLSCLVALDATLEVISQTWTNGYDYPLGGEVVGWLGGWVGGWPVLASIYL